jgi:hypothetical protein
MMWPGTSTLTCNQTFCQEMQQQTETWRLGNQHCYRHSNPAAEHANGMDLP